MNLHCLFKTIYFIFQAYLGFLRNYGVHKEMEITNYSYLHNFFSLIFIHCPYWHLEQIYKFNYPRFPLKLYYQSWVDCLDFLAKRTKCFALLLKYGIHYDLRVLPEINSVTLIFMSWMGSLKRSFALTFSCKFLLSYWKLPAILSKCLLHDIHHEFFVSMIFLILRLYSQLSMSSWI